MKRDFLGTEKIRFSETEYLTDREVISLIYHDIFDYPLSFFELVKWQAGPRLKLVESTNLLFKHKSGFFYLDGKEGIVLKRAIKEKISEKKIRLAKKAASLISFLPTVLFVGITGSLAMKNAAEDSDIDFLIITRKNTLWISRALVLLLLFLFGFKVRRYGKKDIKDALCFNLWLDESALSWRKRNIFTAHEIAQILPLVDKERTYIRFLQKNMWVREYWPNSLFFVKRVKAVSVKKSFFSSLFLKTARFFEPLARWLQVKWMRKKLTKEKVGKNFAVFHPVDLSDFVLARLSSRVSTKRS